MRYRGGAELNCEYNFALIKKLVTSKKLCVIFHHIPIVKVLFEISLLCIVMVCRLEGIRGLKEENLSILYQSVSAKPNVIVLIQSK